MSNATVRESITQSIIKAIESGETLPWRKPWSCSPNCGRPTSVSTGNAYQGINSPLLQMHSNRFGFSSKFWATYKQWDSLGCQVKSRPKDVDRGEWAATAVLYKPVRKKNDEPDKKDDQYLLMRTFKLFNADQVEGAEKFQVDESALAGDTVPDFAPADELIAATEADIRHGGEKAFYRRIDDFIQMPQKHRFNPVGSYYETCLHELAHWSESRLGWDHETNGYAMGELVAELASSMLSAELNVPQGESLENHASYLKSWLEQMKGDSSFIFKASTQASKVCDFLLSHVGQEAGLTTPVAENAG